MQLSAAMQLSAMNVPTDTCGLASTSGSIPKCTAQSFGHVVMLVIGENQAMLTCGIAGAAPTSHVWSAARTLLSQLTIHPGQEVCLISETVVFWAHEPIVVQANASLSLRMMTLTAPITIAEGATLWAHSLRFVDVIGPALSLSGTATITNCTFTGCRAPAGQDGAAIHASGGSLCSSRSTGAPETLNLCTAAAQLNVTNSTFINNTATVSASGGPSNYPATGGRGGAIFMDFPSLPDICPICGGNDDCLCGCLQL
eukprot:SAG31_NODE_403_length_16150_cov_12.566588_18_plen_256_part_00